MSNAQTYAIGTVSVPVFPSSYGEALTVYNSGNQTVYIGDSTGLTVATGFPLSPGSVIGWDKGRGLYAVAAVTDGGQITLVTNSGSIFNASAIADAILDAGLAQDIADAITASTLSDNIAAAIADGTLPSGIADAIAAGPLSNGIANAIADGTLPDFIANAIANGTLPSSIATEFNLTGAPTTQGKKAGDVFVPASSGTLNLPNDALPYHTQIIPSPGAGKCIILNNVIYSCSTGGGTNTVNLQDSSGTTVLSVLLSCLSTPGPTPPTSFALGSLPMPNNSAAYIDTSGTGGKHPIAVTVLYAIGDVA